ncbi:response regulator transcription factor [Cyanobium sp. Morenito 9A2]|uniref:response regulator transcription factor n=1 Tax=Cyanobium sp. Morenito 9A2 TaxID=2823718 RepID=UPI0020CF905D|nr:response regulator transcription factor [Cyanobium sp. Morenito 9A2]MCP9849073.1 response regulator transcription factor [Cyanobium sp. Morenito 9A2]
MDLTPRLEALRQTHAQLNAVLAGRTVLACFGKRSTLSILLADPNRPELVGGATTQSEGLALVERHRPTLLITSERLEQGCGVELALSVKQRHPATLVLVLLADVSGRKLLRRAVEADCDGLCLEKRMGLGTMVEAIRALVGGGLYIDPELRVLLRESKRGEGSELLDRPTARELEVLELMVKGYRNSEIAEALVVSEQTIKTHIGNLLLKLQARNRTHAAVLGLRHELVNWPNP